MDKHRVHLGYSECINCSSVKKYSSHTIYPHKTGGFIQPVTEEQSENLNRLDRRGTGSGKKAKGIMADKSWDRWLKKYEESQSTMLRPSRCQSGQMGRIANPLVVGSNPTLLSMKQALDLVMKEYDKSGYYAACNYTQSLYTDDKITLMNKSKIVNELTEWQMMTTKQRKWQKKLEISG